MIKVMYYPHLNEPFGMTAFSEGPLANLDVLLCNLDTLMYSWSLTVGWNFPKKSQHYFNTLFNSICISPVGYKIETFFLTYLHMKFC